MAQGVSKTFIDLLFHDADASRSRVIISIVILVLLAGLALWLWWPEYWGVVVHVAGAGIGFLIGWLVAGRTASRYEAGLRTHWDRWMQLSEACDTVAELGRKVERKSSANRAYMLAAALTLLWAIELLLIVVAVQGQSEADPWIWYAPVIGANGLLAAYLLGHQAKFASWTRSFAKSLAEMVRDGEIGVWGMR